MNDSQRILLIDDEVSIQRAVAPLLRSRGYEVEVTGTARDALRLFAAQPADLVVLDLGLPDLPGVEVCRRLRAASPVPIVVLSARWTESEKVTVLDLGADDYVTKPFGPEELLARIRVALRRVAGAEPNDKVMKVGPLTIDCDRRRVTKDGAEIRLTPKEFDLLVLLAKNADRVVTHKAILRVVWGANAVNQSEHLWVLVCQLRKKIERDPGSPELLVSEPWVGYRLAAEPRP